MSIPYVKGLRQSRNTPDQKDFQTYLVTHFFGVLIALAELVHSVLPTVKVGNSTVAIEKVIGDDDPVIAKGFITPCLLCSACRGTGASSAVCRCVSYLNIRSPRLC